MKKLTVLVVAALAVLVFSFAAAGEELVFFDSFENNTVGQHPAGWVVNHEFGGIVVDASAVKASDGQLAVELNNTPDLFGQIEHDIPATAVGKLMVDFYQPNAWRENINIELHNASGRIIGVFLTGSGNVRPRPAGVQTGNLANLPNDRWHTMVITWDDKVFNVYYLDNGNLVPILENAELDPAYIEGGPATKVLFNLSSRADAKKGYIDNVRVYDLSK